MRKKLFLWGLIMALIGSQLPVVAAELTDEPEQPAALEAVFETEEPEAESSESEEEPSEEKSSEESSPEETSAEETAGDLEEPSEEGTEEESSEEETLELTEATEEPDIPAAPANVHWNGDTVSWDAVENCSGYEVILYVGSVEKDVLYVAENSCELADLVNYYCGLYYRDTKRGTASVVARVRALFEGEEPGAYGRSETRYVSLTTFKVMAKPTGVKWDDLILRWTAVTGADHYELVLMAGAKEEKCYSWMDPAGTSADLTDQIKELVDRYHQQTGANEVPIRAYLSAVGAGDMDVDSFYAESAAMTIPYPCERERNTINFEDMTLEASSKSRTIRLQATALGSAALTYRSSNSKIKVTSSGKMTIPAKFTGTAAITVTAARAGNYVKTERTMVLTVNPAINAVDRTVSSSASEKIHSLGVKVVGSGSKLTYTCDDERLTITADGKVHVPAHFADTVAIRIDAAANGGTASSKTISFTVTPLTDNTITVTGETVRTYKTKAQTFSLGASAGDKAKLTYKSDNTKIKVSSSGKVTVAKGYLGTATITIRSAETGLYYAAEKQVTVEVIPADNKITVKNVTRKTASLDRRIALGAKVLGRAAMTYTIQSSTMEGPEVSERGSVLIPGGFAGDIVVRIHSAEVYGYHAADKDVTITVNPNPPTLKLTNPDPGSLTVTRGSALQADHYVLQIGTSKYFTAGTYNEEIIPTAETGAFSYSPVTKGKTYYARIRTVTASGHMSAWGSVVTVKCIR